MQIAICDDNRGFLSGFDRQLRSMPQVEDVRSFSSLEAFLSSVEEGRRYDAVFLDIDWGGTGAGLDAAERLEQLSPRTRVVFVTGYNDRFSQSVFLRRANLSGYLVKPVDAALLKANLAKVEEGLRTGEEPVLVVRSRGDVLSIPHREILYLEGQGHNVIIHSLREPVTIYRRLEEVCQALPESFCQCHKSYVVNMIHIRRFQQPDILLKDGSMVPVSRARYARTKERYFRFMGRALF